MDATASFWPPLRIAYEWVHQAAHILANHDKLTEEQVRTQYQAWLKHMETQKSTVGDLSGAIDHFLHITQNFASGLFHCYTTVDLPRTNNDLEQCFGSVRAHERRATGRRGAIPGLVVRGSVRVLTTLVTKIQPLQVSDLQPTDYQAWRDLRRQLEYRQEARRQQFRFRKNPQAYLAAIEARLFT